MEEPISKKNEANASTAKPLGKPPPRDEPLRFEPAIHFYAVEDGDETKGGEEA